MTNKRTYLVSYSARHKFGNVEGMASVTVHNVRGNLLDWQQIMSMKADITTDLGEKEPNLIDVDIIINHMTEIHNP